MPPTITKTYGAHGWDLPHAHEFAQWITRVDLGALRARVHLDRESRSGEFAVTVTFRAAVA